MQKDLIPDTFPELVWKPGELAKPLEQLRAYAVCRAEAAIRWYYRKKRWRGMFCRLCRLSGILLTAYAGVLPMLKEILVGQAMQNPSGWHLAFHPLWSAVALVVVATLYLIDRFYGFTSGWVRYVLTAQQLGLAMTEFQFEVEQQKLGWQNLAPDQAQASKLISTMQQFVKQADSIVNDETRVWAAEFADILRQLDEQVQLASQTGSKAMLHITVTNGEQSAGGWTLKVNERNPESRTGKEAAVEVFPGMHKVQVSAKDQQGKMLQAEKPVKVLAGQIAKVELTLA